MRNTSQGEEVTVDFLGNFLRKQCSEYPYKACDLLVKAMLLRTLCFFIETTNRRILDLLQFGGRSMLSFFVNFTVVHT